MRIVRPRELWDHFQAKRRGEVKVAPYGSRGRVYQPKNAEADPNGGNILKATKKTTATMTMKVTRADGTVEIHEAENVRYG